MKTKNLWRLQELGRLSAYQKLFLSVEDIYVWIIIALCVLGMCFAHSSYMAFFKLFGFIIGIMLIRELVVLCYAKESFELQKGGVCYQTYVHKRKGGFLLELVDKQTKKTTVMTVRAYEAKLLAPQKGLVYCLKGQNEWFLTDPKSDEPVKLGVRLKQTLFSPSKNLLAALDNGSVKYIEADEVYFKVTTCFLEHLAEYDDYFVVENKDKFNVYGILNQEAKEKPVSCVLVQAKALAARNNEKAIALYGNNSGEYELIGWRQALSPLDDKEISMP